MGDLDTVFPEDQQALGAEDADDRVDVRGHLRPKDPQRWVAFKMYFRLSSAQASELVDASELMLYPGGYGGIQPVEGGIANLCCVVQQRYLARAGHRCNCLG